MEIEVNFMSKTLNRFLRDLGNCLKITLCLFAVPRQRTMGALLKDEDILSSKCFFNVIKNWSCI